MANSLYSSVLRGLFNRVSALNGSFHKLTGEHSQCVNA